MRERKPLPLSTLLWEKRLWQGKLDFWGSDPFDLSGERRRVPRAVCTCRYMCGVVFLCMCTSICVCLCVYINLWYIWIPVYMNMSAWACTCVCVCVHKCVLAHTCKLRNVTCCAVEESRMGRFMVLSAVGSFLSRLPYWLIFVWTFQSSLSCALSKGLTSPWKLSLVESSALWGKQREMSQGKGIFLESPIETLI